MIIAAALSAGCASTPDDSEEVYENSVDRHIREEEVWRQESAERFPNLDAQNKVLRTFVKGMPVTF